MNPCVCGHGIDEHHRVWWTGGAMIANECEFYGCNETGGMKQTLTGKFFYRVLPPAWVSNRNQWFRNFMRRVPGFRGPWYKDHCHQFKEDM